jgi:hypothetical protein
MRYQLAPSKGPHITATQANLVGQGLSPSIDATSNQCIVVGRISTRNRQGGGKKVFYHK